MPKQHSDHEFLPAALEISESPPNPLARRLIWVLSALFAIAVVWAWLGKIDVVAVAPGKIVVSERSKIMQATELAVVRAIHVRDGQQVLQDEVLLELDTTQAQADSTRLQNEQMAAQKELARQQQFLRFLDGKVGNGQTPDKNIAIGDLVGDYQQKYAVAQQAEITQRNERDALAQSLKKLEQNLPLVQQRQRAYQDAFARNVIAEVQWLQVQQEAVEAQRNMAVTREQFYGANARVDQAYAQLNGVVTEYRRLTQERIREAELRLNASAQEHVKAQQRQQWLTLRAPVAGVVQQLSVHTVGGVVNPNDKLMVIAPQGDSIEVEALVQNKDIGFVRAGQEVQVKLDAFPFTRYGTLNGKLASISADAIAHEQLGWVFSARVLLDKSTINIDGSELPISAGMTTVAEVRTGERSLMEYLLSPLIARADEAATER